MSAAPALLEPLQVFDAASFAAGAGATATQMVDLEQLRSMLADWNERINLVSAASLAEFWPRHALDSAQLLRIAPAARTWVDIGAGDPAEGRGRREGASGRERRQEGPLPRSGG
jgi:16S rRNA (guanine527-N7)-methyltransferase